jgi:hypothetical protein
VIQWKSKTNGRVGRGSKRFEEQEAMELVAELNADYPDIHHEAVPSDSGELVAAAATEPEVSNPSEAPSSSSGESRPAGAEPAPLPPPPEVLSPAE